MSTQPTPGPWRWSYHPVNNERIALVSADGATDVLLCTGDDSNAWGETSEADAKLIAAAPDLLAMLEKCFWHFGNEIKRMPLNDSAATGTQAMSQQVAKLLDAVRPLKS